MKKIKARLKPKKFLLYSVFLFAFVYSRQTFSQNRNWDINTLDKINSNASPFGDKAFKFISQSVTPVYIGTPVILFSSGLIRGDSALKVNALGMAASFVLNSAITFSIKISIKRDRPFTTYNFLEKKDVGGSYSFPSGHTAAAFGLATSLSLVYPKWYVIAPAFTYAALVGYSRMYLGVHYPTDVLGGMVIGVGISLLSWEAQKWLIKRSR